MCMKKKIIIILLIIGLTTITFFSFFGNSGKKCKTDEMNQVRTNIEQYLSIVYGWGSEKNLSEIMTPELIEALNIKPEDNSRQLYLINRNFMDSYCEIDKSIVQVRLTRYEIGLTCHTIFTLKKYKDGRIFITDVDTDI